MLQSETIKKYEKYKDSGIEWIGEIPQNWNVRKLFGLLKTIGSGTTPKGNDNYYDGNIYWLNTGDLNDSYIKEINKTVTDLAMSECSALKFFDADSVVIAMYGATIGKLGILTFQATTNQACCVMSCGNKLNNKYLFYVLYSARDYILTLSYGAGQPNISQETIKAFRLCCPNIDEQRIIADYLDKKCSGIDKIVETEKSVIEKLKEYKQSIITEAVTKGLYRHCEECNDEAIQNNLEIASQPAAARNDVKYKDSGIEWIGKIPQHWKVTQISKLYNIILGKMLCPNPLSNSDTLENYLCSANIKFEGIKTDEIKQMYFNQNEKEIYLLKENDIVISEGGDAGTASIYKNEAYPCYIQNAVHKVFLKDNTITLNKFLYYWIFFCKKCGYVDLICNKATIMHYTKEKVSKTPIVFLSKEEQQQIVGYLDKKCSEIDKAIADKELVIEKFTEYKKSLIYECVTGKRKVCNESSLRGM